MMQNMVDGIVENFGEEEAEGYVKLIKAVRALITIGGLYYLQPEGTEMERILSARFDLMIEKLAEHPEKMKEMTAALVALIIHLMEGGTYEEWLETVGLEPLKGLDD